MAFSNQSDDKEVGATVELAVVPSTTEGHSPHAVRQGALSSWRQMCPVQWEVDVLAMLPPPLWRPATPSRDIDLASPRLSPSASDVVIETDLSCDAVRLVPTYCTGDLCTLTCSITAPRHAVECMSVVELGVPAGVEVDAEAFLRLQGQRCLDRHHKNEAAISVAGRPCGDYPLIAQCDILSPRRLAIYLGSLTAAPPHRAVAAFSRGPASLSSTPRSAYGRVEFVILVPCLCVHPGSFAAPCSSFRSFYTGLTGYAPPLRATISEDSISGHGDKKKEQLRQL